MLITIYVFDHNNIKGGYIRFSVKDMTHCCSMALLPPTPLQSPALWKIRVMLKVLLE